MLQMTCIALPKRARPHDVYFEECHLSAYNEIRQRREEMLRVIQREVQEYVNDDSLTYPESNADGFPSRGCLTGQYYIADESYRERLDAGVRWFEIGVQTICLGKPACRGRPDVEGPQDYLGLHVWIRCDPESWAFSLNGNTDSSVA